MSNKDHPTLRDTQHNHYSNQTSILRKLHPIDILWMMKLIPPQSKHKNNIGKNRLTVFRKMSEH